MRYLILLVTTLLFGYEPPFNTKEFHSVLLKSKLQAPTSKYNPLYGTHYGMFQGVAHKYFHLDKEKHLQFFMCGKKHRSELRQQDDWLVEDTTPHRLYAEVKLDPHTIQKEFTFLQIHADPHKKSLYNKQTNKPLLRVVWRRNYKHLSNHLWAIICTNMDNKYPTYTKIDLGELKRSKYHKFLIEVANSQLKIYVDDILKVDFDISYAKGIWQYYKAGVYLQSKGCAKAVFKTLQF